MNLWTSPPFNRLEAYYMEISLFYVVNKNRRRALYSLIHVDYLHFLQSPQFSQNFILMQHSSDQFIFVYLVYFARLGFDNNNKETGTIDVNPKPQGLINGDGKISVSVILVAAVLFYRHRPCKDMIIKPPNNTVYSSGSSLCPQPTESLEILFTELDEPMKLMVCGKQVS